MADAELFEARGDLIDGAFALPDAGATSGEIAAEEPGDLDAQDGAFPFATAHVDAAVAAARRAWPAWRDASPDARATCLRRLGEQIEAQRERLAEAIAREVGKPLWEARTEVTAMIGKIEITLSQGLELVAERSFDLPGGQVARWRAHARGALAVLGPFNFPGHLVHGHVVPALATGNTVVIKPSERTPAVGQLYAELLARSGFPDGVVNVVQGDGASGARLAACPDLDGVLFTGSWAVGRAILEANLDQMHKILALEMGGKNGVIVCDDADLEAAARAIVFGACATTGQRCSATSRVIALPAIADALCERVAALLRDVRVGHPLADDVFMGPLISSAARGRHEQALAWAAAEGAERIVDGGPCDGPDGKRGWYVRPSLNRLSGLRADSRYQREEHFAPDLWLWTAPDLDAAIAALDDTDFGLVGSVFTAARDTFERVWRETRLGLLNWNATTVGASSKLPFGGTRRSGNDQPAGATSTSYCTYPVASLELAVPPSGADAPTWPGFPGPRGEKR